MLRRVWFVGTHSTGKTTQLKLFKEAHPEFNVGKFRRRELRNQGIIKVNRDAAPWDELIISGDILNTFLTTPTPFVMDRSWIDKCAYAQCLPVSSVLLRAYHTVYTASFTGVDEEIDRYIYFPPVIPLEDDGVRDTDPEYRADVDFWVQWYLDYFLGSDYYILKTDNPSTRLLEIEKYVFS